MSILLEFLTESQLKEVRTRSLSDESTYSITTSYGKLNKQQSAVINQYVRELKYPSKPVSKLGSKQEAYNTEEEMLSKGPEYSFDDLSARESAFYDNYEKEKKNG